MKILQITILLLCILSNPGLASEAITNSEQIGLSADQQLDRRIIRPIPRLTTEEHFVNANTMRIFNSENLAMTELINRELEKLIAERFDTELDLNLQKLKAQKLTLQKTTTRSNT